jgi:hypothetical protein
MLWLCLEHFAACPESADVRVWVYVDAHVNQPSVPREEILAVVKKFPQLSVEVTFRAPHRYLGNSFNVLMAYKDAYQSKAQHVFLIEDDVVISPGFFAWHRAQHDGHLLGCSIAIEKGPRQGPYASLGVCFRREVLQVVVPHCNDAYFRSMEGYIRERFFSKGKPALDYEQDGLIARLLDGYKVAWAQTPLAQHVGWYGYHRARSTRPKGSLEDRYRQIRHVLSDSHLLRVWSRDFGDIVPLQLSADGR